MCSILIVLLCINDLKRIQYYLLLKINLYSMHVAILYINLKNNINLVNFESHVCCLNLYFKQ